MWARLQLRVVLTPGCLCEGGALCTSLRCIAPPPPPTCHLPGEPWPGLLGRLSCFLGPLLSLSQQAPPSCLPTQGHVPRGRGLCPAAPAEMRGITLALRLLWSRRPLAHPGWGGPRHEVTSPPPSSLPQAPRLFLPPQPAAAREARERRRVRPLTPVPPALARRAGHSPRGLWGLLGLCA